MIKHAYSTFEQLYIIQQNGDKKEQIYRRVCYLLKTLNSLINLQLDVLGLEETVTKKIWRA